MIYSKTICSDDHLTIKFDVLPFITLPIPPPSTSLSLNLYECFDAFTEENSMES